MAQHPSVEMGMRPEAPSDQQRPGGPAVGWRLAVVTLLLAAVIAAAGFLLFDRQREELLAQARAELIAAVRSKAENISNWRTERIQDAEAVTNQSTFVSAVERWLQGGTSGPPPLLVSEELAHLAGRERYRQAALYDPRGNLLANAGAAPSALSPPVREQLFEAADAGEVRFAQVVESERLDFAFFAPVRGADGTIAVLYLRIDPLARFLPMLRLWPGHLGTAGAQLASRLPDGRILFLSSRVPAGLERTETTPELVGAQALRGASGLLEGLDYRGVPVLAAARQLPDLPWVLVVKVDRAEVVAPIREVAFTTTATALLVLLLGASAASLWFRRQKSDFAARWYERAYWSQVMSRRFEFLAHYANDAILLLDHRGVVLEASDRADSMYGYPVGTMVGRSWGEFSVSETIAGGIGSADTGDALIYEAWHRCADGTLIPVEVSARILELERDTYYQVIVRDISERREAEQRILRLRDFYAALSQTNEVLIRVRDEPTLYREVCRIAVERGRFVSASITLLDDHRGVIPVAAAGAGAEEARQSPEPYDYGNAGILLIPAVSAVLADRTCVFNGFPDDDPTYDEWRDEALAEGVRAIASFPLHRSGSAVGSLCVFSEHEGVFEGEVVNLLREMAADISFALDNLERERIRQQAEHALRLSEQRYWQLVENMSSGVTVYQPTAGGKDFVVGSINRGAEVIEQIRRKETVGRSVREALPGLEAMGLLDVLRRVWRTGVPESHAGYFLRSSGDTAWRETYVYLLPTGEVVTVYDDVTARVKAEQALRENEERLSLAMQATNDGFWDFDVVTGELLLSERYSELLGLGREQLPREFDEWLNLIHPEDRPRAHAEFEAHLRGETERFHSEHRMRTASGDYRWVLVRGRVVARDPDGRPLRMAGTHTDISERKAQEERLRLWSLVFANSGEGIFITNGQRRIVSVNRAFCEMTEYPPEELYGRSPNILSSGLHDAAFYQVMWDSLDRTGRWQGEVWDRRKSGEAFPAWAAINVVRDDSGTITHYIGMFTDVSERKEAEERIHYLAHRDFLTGLPNRILLHDRLHEALAHARRTGSRVAVLFVDLDRFKNVNDSLGHPMGDRLLQQAANRLAGAVREGDTVSRPGGDEFILALTDFHDPDDAARVAEKIVKSISQPFQLADHEVTLSASVGIALFPEDGTSIDTLISNADAAMYEAKNRGRASYQFFVPELNERAMRRVRLQNELRRSLEENAFELWYQPQVDTASGRVYGAEALVRWRRNGELLLPNEFIATAEETGLIIPLGDWVIREATAQQARWQREGLQLLVAINITASQFHHRGFRKGLQEIISAAGTHPEHLELELTERMVMSDVTESARLLHEIKSMGMALAIDDFGTGYSSLSYLRRFPIDRLKVDQSFVQDMSTDAADRAITEAIIGLGHSLGLQVIAEGVETSQEAAMLRRRGCNALQGFYFGPPMPPAAFRQRLDAGGFAGGVEHPL